MKNKYYILLILLVFSAANLFAQNVIPIIEGQSYSEDFESGQMDGWTVESTGTATWAVMGGTVSNVAAFQNATMGDAARLISPTFDMSSISGATFNFRYAMMALYPPYDELTVCYRSAPTDSWHELGNYSLSDWSNVFDETFELPAISATYQISFLGNSNGGYYIFIDDIEITSSEGCARPMNLQASEITNSTALLGWSTTGNEDTWDIEINSEQKTVDVQPFLMEGLEPETEFTFRVRANCGNDMESEWSYPATFKTHCDVIVVTDDEPYFDDFEGSDEFLCWQNDISSGDFGWAIDPGYLILNNTANFFWMGGEALLYSAPLDITAVTNPTLQFKHKQQLLEDVDHLYVAYRSSPTDTWHVIGIYEYPANDWEEVTLALPNASAEYQIGFDAIASNGNGNGVYVDDVWVGNLIDDDVEEMTVLVASVYPNPATEKVAINTNVPNGEVTVFDLTGRIVTTLSFREGHVELDLDGLAQGVYMVRVSNDNGNTTLRLVKE